MARKSPQEAVDKWQRRTAQAGQDYAQGVDKATGWADKATAAGRRRDIGLQNAIANGSIDAGIRRVGDAGWKNATKAKGVPAWQGAVAKSGSNFLQGLQKAYGFLGEADSVVANMPEDTVEQRIAKAGAYQLAVHQASQRAKGQG